ncbi:MAG: aspartate--tRNA ligase [Gammaproteobacteria bacterium]|nr:aspartate--tRNA ligase [Gammaproteobacteria bacterium]MYF62134.1 aspartate--tRNA ligase [Gammaproteobacteria bacterium]MYI22814.1 aspartate--tRNA ligase [Gammaproteobacteria bacterium]
MTDLKLERTSRRSRMAGSLREQDAGRTHRLAGWVHRRRDLGGMVFIDLRDRSGIVQVSFGPDWTEPESFRAAGKLGAEDVIAVLGEVVRRPPEARNPEMATGAVELQAASFELLGDADTPAIPVHQNPGEEPPAEELRLLHRHLDLRRAPMQAALELRHRLVLETRNYLDRLGFLEIETPILTKPMPEGARDFLVPSRVHPGEFYALPQSPQIYKQILMTAGFDRYFQIARCFRDEDQRTDRQPEFTQIDVEASFIAPEDLLGWIEGLMVRLSEVAGMGTPAPFQRMAYRDALECYGSDRPDLRFGLEIEDWSEPFADVDFRITRAALDAGGRVRGLRLPGGASLSRKQVGVIESAARKAGAPGLLWVKRTEDGGSGPLARFLGAGHYDALGLRAGDLALAAAGPDAVTSPALAAARLRAVDVAAIPRDREHGWAWILDFPLFDPLPDGAGITFNHHPFVMPAEEDLPRLESDPLSCGARAYDLVYNGSELGSGSLRIHDAALQERVLRVLGLGDRQIEERFGFLLRALRSGAPPHGGIALGMDRIVQHFAGAASLRDVIAFPKTTAARALFEAAPGRPGRAELEALKLA